MMRNIISITVLFSLIITFANFDIVRILTNGGPQDQTHLFATYAFQVGIQSGDIPLGAAVSLFMFPILAVFAFFVLRGVTRRSKEAHVSATTLSSAAAAQRRAPGQPARAQPALALWGSYAALRVFVVFFLIPPFYMLITSFKTSAEISNQAGNPWIVTSPTLSNLCGATDQRELPWVLLELDQGHVLPRGIVHVHLGAGGVQPGADEVLGQRRPGHGHLPDLPGAGQRCCSSRCSRSSARSG